MFIAHLRRTGAAHGRHPDRSSYQVQQTEPVLSRLWQVCQKAALPEVSSVQLWHWASAARPLLGLFSCQSGSSRPHLLVCPVCHALPKVPGWAGRRACGSHTSVSSNARMRGSTCPEAWAPPVPERVGPKVEANRHKSQLSSSDEAGWKRGRNARTLVHVCRGALRVQSQNPDYLKKKHSIQ
jgi:hypothetical protein